MFQTDQPTAVSTLPAPAAAGTPGYFTNGNPGAGLAPTILGADFMNMVMMELINVVTAAGLTPSKTNYSQVLAAIKALGVTASSATPNGYLKLSNGFIFQWGSANTSASADVAVIFPTPFLTAVFQVLTSANLTAAAGMTGANAPTLNGFNLNGWATNGSNSRIAVNASWFAIGK
jgi:hypothetical protein